MYQCTFLFLIYVFLSTYTPDNETWTCTFLQILTSTWYHQILHFFAKEKNDILFLFRCAINPERVWDSHFPPPPPTPNYQFKPLTIFYWVEFDVLLSKFFVPSSFQSHFFSDFFPVGIYVGIGVRQECCSILLYLHKHLMLSNQTIE